MRAGIPFFALTFRGLEAICAEEIAQLPGLTVHTTSYRRVSGECQSALNSLLQLRTADDVFLKAADWSGIERQRSTLTTLRLLSEQLDLHPLAAVIAQIRPLNPSLTFSVTANFVGKRNYTTEEIKLMLAAGIQQNHPWQYTEDDAQADLNIRLFIERTMAVVGLRLSKRPLHERAFKHNLSSGSLKPPVAAAMLQLAEIKTAARVLDPCCGAATLLIEAAFLGINACGGDLDRLALQAASMNMQQAGFAFPLIQWDARRLPIPSASVPYLVSNLPWGRQVTVNTALESFYRDICAEMRRILAPAGRIVLLTSLPQFVSFPDLNCTQRLEISLFGQTPTILVFSG